MAHRSNHRIAFFKIGCLLLLCILPAPVWVACVNKPVSPITVPDTTTARFSDTAYFRQFNTIFYDTLDPARNAFIAALLTNGAPYHSGAMQPDTITWSLTHGTPDLPDDEETRMITNALKTWESVLPLHFVHVPFNGDIDYKWSDCSSDNARGRCMTQGFGDVITKASIMFFERRKCGTTTPDEIDWSQKEFFFTTAVHETGHALGLGDIKPDGTILADSDYIPFPVYNVSIMEYTGRFLTDYDYALVHHAYGAPEYVPLISIYINADSSGRPWHDHYTFNSWNVANKIVQSAGFDSMVVISLLGTIAKNPLPGTVPLYRYWYMGDSLGSDHLDTLAQFSAPQWRFDGIIGYVYESPSQDYCALYEYYNPTSNKHRIALDTNLGSEGITTRTLLGYIDCSLKWE